MERLELSRKNTTMKMELHREYFSYGKKQFIDKDSLSAVLFKYDTGICAVKLSNNFGYITVLPYNGQMIWDAAFGGRSLKMQTLCIIPQKTDSFLDTYGCYMMHCGALSMGCPGENDNHPHHGELPYASYDKAWITSGKNSKGEYIGVSGSFEYKNELGDNYVALPETRLYAEDTVLSINIEVKNIADKPMDFMYLCHINNYPKDGGRIVQALPWTNKNMQIRYSIPDNDNAQTVKSFVEKIQSDRSITATMRKEDPYDPEVCFFLDKPKTDDKGFSHFLFIHPDGSADYTSYKPNELDHCTRWIANTEEMKAMGMALPATADAEGYTAEKEKGNVKTIVPKESFKTTIYTGYLQKEIADQMENIIISL